MKITMVSTNRACCAWRSATPSYKPDANGEFLIDEESHVQGARYHGFIMRGELAPRKSLKAQNVDLLAENAELKAQLQTKNGKSK